MNLRILLVCLGFVAGEFSINDLTKQFEKAGRIVCYEPNPHSAHNSEISPWNQSTVSPFSKGWTFKLPYASQMKFILHLCSFIYQRIWHFNNFISVDSYPADCEEMKTKSGSTGEICENVLTCNRIYQGNHWNCFRSGCLWLWFKMLQNILNTDTDRVFVSHWTFGETLVDLHQDLKFWSKSTDKI